MTFCHSKQGRKDSITTYKVFRFRSAKHDAMNTYFYFNFTFALSDAHSINC